ACEVEGVAGMDEAAARHFGDWVRRQTAHRGVRVQVEADRSIHLEVFISVDSESQFAPVASAVQSNVVEATERMLGLEVGEVNVFVSSVAFAHRVPVGKRHHARELALKVLFQLEGSSDDPEEVLLYHASENGASVEITDFARQLTRGVL